MDFSNNRRLIILGVAVVAMVASAVLFVFSGDGSDQNDPAPVSSKVDAEVAAPTENAVDEPANIAPADVKPAFDIVRISRTGTGIIAGRMQPGADVSLKANGEVIASVVADENGEWVILLDEPLESGSVEFTLNGVAQGSSQGVDGEDAVIVSVPEREADDLLERTESGVVAVLTPLDGEGASTVLQRPGARAPADLGDSLSVVTLDYGDGGAAVITGTGVPRFEVRLYLNGEFVGRDRVADDGSWSVTLAEPLSQGTQLLRVDQTIGDGSVQLRIEQPFAIGAPLDPSTASSGIVVQPGNTLWNIARQLYGTGVRYTVIFRENAEQIKDPDLIYPGQLFQIPVKPSEPGGNAMEN